MQKLRFNEYEFYFPVGGERPHHKNGLDNERESKTNGETEREPSPYLPAMPFSDPYMQENEWVGSYYVLWGYYVPWFFGGENL